MPDHDDVGTRPPRDQVLVDIAREMTRLYREQFGRGPSQSRAHWAGPDTLVAVLEGSLTPAERNLVRMGEHERTRDVRLVFQHAQEHDVRAAVEAASGRRVRAFVSGIDATEDVAIELFVLHPPVDVAPQRSS